ncbi:VTT domain-containing protein [Roseisolibacter sp. H3M3-2]|uniref:DedA family protein n=1 Tax=Roseisolibacter sp. H3M3-2 TaxID=3031323 RepID=UPI0023DCCCE5|nr:VTT domain-containing protein [Roseisolibacter sp. H3M3-2]MDF1503013.1 VTT domain-containing protein [Roseisolibacter sp. H3M3-2]
MVVPLLPAAAQLSAAALTHGERLWLYLTFAATPIVTEELAPLLAGVAASQGQVRLVPVIVALTLGGWVATTLLYVLGWWRGRWVRRRWPRANATMKKWLRAVRRRPWRTAVAVRFAFGARLLLPLACGAAHVRPDIYLIGSLASSALWSAIFALLGHAFGATALEALQAVRRYDQYAVGVLVGLAVVAWLMIRRRRRARRAAGGSSTA